jgi:hypothetical protein
MNDFYINKSKQHSEWIIIILFTLLVVDKKDVSVLWLEWTFQEDYSLIVDVLIKT